MSRSAAIAALESIDGVVRRGGSDVGLEARAIHNIDRAVEMFLNKREAFPQSLDRHFAAKIGYTASPFSLSQRLSTICWPHLFMNSVKFPLFPGYGESIPGSLE